jgi:transcriptional regulator with XRE-family HTH domain
LAYMANTNQDKPLGETVRNKRVELDLSLRDLAKRLQLTPSYLSDIENDRRVPAEEVIRNIAQVLALDFDLLMARAGRFGDEAIRYMKRNPSVGVLFRRLAQHEASGDMVKDLIRRTESLAEKKKESGK